jgi:hypothetical protein
MVISTEQMAQLQRASISSFETRMLDHLKRCFPKVCASQTELEIREEIRRGIQKAVAYGFGNELEICKFINLMCFFGRDFDVQKEPWASACKLAQNSREFQQKWDEAYDSLITNSTKANS